VESLSRRSLLRGLGASAAAGALLAACSSESSRRSTTGSGGPRRVNTSGQPIASAVMIGDSITAGSVPQLQFAFASEGITNFVVDAQSGRRIAAGRTDREPTPGLFALQTLLDAGNAPDLWIIALGTNDIGSLGDPAATGELIDSLLDMLPDGNPLTWIDCHRPQIPDQMAMFNLVLRDRLTARGNATVASWASKVIEPDVDYLVDDRIHPNAAGTQAFAEVAITALRR
jgi:lysophospholipase L1-like esterase